ncbi:MAG: hypothetical protein OEZ32_10455 [Nitrospinota bacterium]|nr:hypothetical protein [Nitrospinota bacterium]
MSSENRIAGNEGSITSNGEKFSSGKWTVITTTEILQTHSGPVRGKQSSRGTFYGSPDIINRAQGSVDMLLVDQNRDGYKFNAIITSRGEFTVNGAMVIEKHIPTGPR